MKPLYPVLKPPPKPRLELEDAVVQPPASAQVDFDRRVVLYAPDGKGFVRKAGF